MNARRMLVVTLLAVAGLAAAARPARAQGGGPFGLGLILGSPTGVSGKLYLNRQNAIDGAIGVAVLGADGWDVHADYLWHPAMLVEDEAFFLPVYVGGGARILQHTRSRGRKDDLHIGARVPVGILFDFRTVPLDVFLEVALVVDLLVDESDADDHSRAGLNAGLGARYYF